MNPSTAVSIRDSLTQALTSPTAAKIWKLRADLLEAGIPAGSRSFVVLGEFQQYLDRLATGTSSRDYSQLASKLDLSAVGGVVLEQILENKDDEGLGGRLFAGLLSEGLMVLATRQHVKAWEGELGAVYRSAAWFLYEELWRWARERKPKLSSSNRRRLLDGLFAPVHDAGTAGFQKALLIGHLFQLLLASYVSGEFASKRRDHPGDPSRGG